MDPYRQDLVAQFIHSMGCEHPAIFVYHVCLGFKSISDKKDVSFRKILFISTCSDCLKILPLLDLELLGYREIDLKYIYTIPHLERMQVPRLCSVV
jgi:hypothetical protein